MAIQNILLRSATDIRWWVNVARISCIETDVTFQKPTLRLDNGQAIVCKASTGELIAALRLAGWEPAVKVGVAEEAPGSE